MGPSIQDIQQEVLESYKKEFDLLSSSLQQLDNKAQGSATVAGAFLAAGLAILNRPNIMKIMWADILLTVTILGLMAAILLSIQALRIRKILNAPSGHELDQILEAIRKQPDDELPERLQNFYRDTFRLWATCIRSRENANKWKGRFVWLSQISLTASAFCVGLLVLIILWKG